MGSCADLALLRPIERSRDELIRVAHRGVELGAHPTKESVRLPTEPAHVVHEYTLCSVKRRLTQGTRATPGMYTPSDGNPCRRGQGDCRRSPESTSATLPPTEPGDRTRHEKSGNNINFSHDAAWHRVFRASYPGPAREGLVDDLDALELVAQDVQECRLPRCYQMCGKHA